MRTHTIAALLLAAGFSLPALAADAPTESDQAATELSCTPMPEAPSGHFVCEDRDSFERCKALEGRGTLQVDGEPAATPVIHCEQGG
ncbi:hypothetical protein E4T66_11820 [Sinimarinibacterium sp. CAU 1509]|uniref:hypothetical protein n=1 Tax=Sinimarinibacterium sp. CAU 1509 TaxID=2562283 RepID=UPI0010AC71A3|nr:hypothetical protein [Sinimarinibacterium sp. CAU 1509]TJY59863.1 hypothetical protein E4T66_11820 [Sinimarinibacterium sp. CAU 1509]